MASLPSYMWLSGDENGGVWLVCDHHDCHRTDHFAVAHHAGHGERDADGLPHFSQLGEFVAFINEHADRHQAGEQS